MYTINRHEETLNRLLRKAADTQIGRKYGFGDIGDYTTFAERLPIQFYGELQAYIEEIKKGSPDILWPGKVSRFALSAGTTGKGKHLPLTADRLESDRKFMKSLIADYLRQRPNPFRLFGKHLSLPGTVEQHGDIQIGEVSGFSALRSPLWLRPFQLANPKKLTQLSFSDKFELLLEGALTSNLKVITAVPSWILTLFQRALRESDKESIAEVWPGLKLLVCGGVKLAHYRPHLQKLMGELKPDFIETYGASEGYLAYSDDLQREDMKLITGNGIFYEFVPNPLPDDDALAIQDAVPLWEVETGVPYAVIVSTNAGLWRYALRDIIEFTSVDPHRIIVKGRVSDMLDDFGEGLYLHEARQALDVSVKELNLQKSAFTIVPLLPSESHTPYHHWLVQFTDGVHRQTLDRLAERIDRQLQQTNRHYAIRRESGALGAPKMGSISQQDINRWMEAGGRAKAQGKLPGILRENTDVLI